MKTIIAYLRQPTSIAGLASITGGLTLLTLHGNQSTALSMIVGGAVAFVLPDNTSLKAPLLHAAQDAVEAAAKGGAAGAVTALVGDAPAVLEALQTSNQETSHA